MFIFGMPTLINHKQKTKELGLLETHGAWKGPGRLHETSDKYKYFQKIVLLFQRITVIPENYNQQNYSLHLRKLQSAKTVLYILENYNQQQPLKAKTTRKRKGKPKKEKIWEERYSIRKGT